jgi:hypothetical protein
MTSFSMLHCSKKPHFQIKGSILSKNSHYQFHLCKFFRKILAWWVSEKRPFPLWLRILLTWSLGLGVLNSWFTKCHYVSKCQLPVGCGDQVTMLPRWKCVTVDGDQWHSSSVQCSRAKVSSTWTWKLFLDSDKIIVHSQVTSFLSSSVFSGAWKYSTQLWPLKPFHILGNGSYFSFTLPLSEGKERKFTWFFVFWGFFFLFFFSTQLLSSDHFWLEINQIIVEYRLVPSTGEMLGDPPHLSEVGW